MTYLQAQDVYAVGLKETQPAAVSQDCVAHGRRQAVYIPAQQLHPRRGSLQTVAKAAAVGGGTADADAAVLDSIAGLQPAQNGEGLGSLDEPAEFTVQGNGFSVE